MTIIKKVTLSISLLIPILQGYGQILHPVKWSYAAKKVNAKEAVLFIRATIDKGWHIYSIDQPDGGPRATVFTFSLADGYELKGKITEPKPHKAFDNNFKIEVLSHEKQVVFQQRVALKTNKQTIKGKVEFMVCNDHQCLPPDEVAFEIPVI